MKSKQKHKIFYITLLVIFLGFVACMFMLNNYKYEVNREADRVARIQIKTKYEIGKPTAQEMLELVNKERAKYGVAPLTINENVQKVAQMKADDMNARNYFQHNVLGTNYTLTNDMAKIMNMECIQSSENIYKWYDATSQSAFDWWKNSEPHYKAILNPKYKTTGFGVAGEQNMTVQKFCIPK